MRIVISGANGFVGKALTALAIDSGHQAVALVRRPGSADPRASECVIGDDNFAGIAADAAERIGSCDAFVHLAARVHVMRDQAADPLAEFRAANVDGALNAAAAAARAGARRFVLVSSIKALGEGEPGRPWREDDPPSPTDPYGISKHEAEVALKALGFRRGLEIVVVRPPLVYGAGVGANFLAMMRAVDKGIPLPLAAVGARRSLVHVDNLADALLHCATDRRAAGARFHVADDDPPTVPELLRMIGAALGRPARLFPVPVAALRLAGALTGRRAAIERLTDSLRLDTDRIGTALGWRPPNTTAQGLEETALWYRSRHTKRQ